ncbi:MAG: hypothetical protein JO058_22060 [Alphaproteobacteria bacterium]|nr:hypothetical protein [Alphaproteobacteria bacterium]
MDSRGSSGCCGLDRLGIVLGLQDGGGEFTGARGRFLFAFVCFPEMLLPSSHLRWLRLFLDVAHGLFKVIPRLLCSLVGIVLGLTGFLQFILRRF